MLNSLKIYSMPKKKGLMDPTKITWGETQKMVTDWSSARERHAAALVNNGNPTSNVSINAASDSKKKHKNKKKNSNGSNNNNNNNNNSNNTAAAAKDSDNSVLTCRVCGYNAGHKTADCTQVNGNVKQLLLATEKSNENYFKKRQNKGGKKA